MRILTLVLLGIVVSSSLASHAQSTPAATPVSEISADQGSCSALITVTDADSKPVYLAKVSTRVLYGFMGLKKLDLEIFTNPAGQAKITHLPAVLKKPELIRVTKDNLLVSVEFKPEAQCQATLNVQLK
jgi:hypothetical protein